MLKVFVCDDEAVHRNRITKIIKNYLLMMDYDIEFQFATENPQDILAYISVNKTEGVYFLDIDLKAEMNGVEQVKKFVSMIQLLKLFLSQLTLILSI